ncbi:MAG: ribosome biogenesis GTPase YlqF, partial [Lachnospiraceae bacterium]|nr:ribosome biogenesis GTPase YlqF [Lachnospiraceae bacterium]
MDIQWYPGHMTKARRQMQEDMKLIDIVIEILDARAPLSSRNPDINKIAGSKKRLVILNKADMADKNATKQWKRYYEARGIFAEAVDARSKTALSSITPTIMKACAEKLERDKKRGIMNRPLRAMVVGIPNSGKSTLINTYAGKAAAKTGNKPGVTKGKQWIRLNKQIELLDTPGILWPKFEDPDVGKKLAMVGSVKDELLNIPVLACELLKLLLRLYPGTVSERYGTDEAKYSEMLTPERSSAFAEILCDIAVARNCKLKGDEPDTDKAAKLVLDDFRSGRLGRLTLELPERESEEAENKTIKEDQTPETMPAAH